MKLLQIIKTVYSIKTINGGVFHDSHPRHRDHTSHDDYNGYEQKKSKVIR